MRKRQSSAKRRKVELSRNLEGKLFAYALAATAAGVGAITFVPQAEGKVIYTNKWILIDTPITNIDLNNDGIVDFAISMQVKKSCSEFGGCAYSQKMILLPQNSANAAWGTGTAVSALGSGVELGSSGKFQAGHRLMESSVRGYGRYGTPGYGSKGNWGQTVSRFLGVKFIIQGEVHYGWVQADVAPTQNGILGAISGYAYETVPNKPLKTGQRRGAMEKKNNGRMGSVAADDLPAPPGQLGLLAIGALGLESWRRPRSTSSYPRLPGM